MTSPNLAVLAGEGILNTVSQIEAGTIKLVLAYNSLVDKYEAEHDLRLRAEVKLRLANEELERLRAR